MTASSFEQWDELLSEMYDYLAGVLNADQYASEEENYKKWVAERDSGAENAASATEDSTQKQLASYSFKQSYQGALLQAARHDVRACRETDVSPTVLNRRPVPPVFFYKDRCIFIVDVGISFLLCYNQIKYC